MSLRAPWPGGMPRRDSRTGFRRGAVRAIAETYRFARFPAARFFADFRTNFFLAAFFFAFFFTAFRFAFTTGCFRAACFVRELRFGLFGLVLEARAPATASDAATMERLPAPWRTSPL